jgi:hypothetical protein
MVPRTCADLSPSSDLISMDSTTIGTAWDASSDQLVHRKQVRPLWLPNAIGTNLNCIHWEVRARPNRVANSVIQAGTMPGGLW